MPVELAYGGTCTAGKNEDMDMYAQVLADALRQGKCVADSVQFYIQFGSQETRDYCVRRGYLEVFQRAGAHIIEPSCGACINAGPGVSTRPDQVVISAQNRNFPGRSGPGQMYLASPLTVAASAVAGYIVEYEPSQQRALTPPDSELLLRFALQRRVGAPRSVRGFDVELNLVCTDFGFGKQLDGRALILAVHGERKHVAVELGVFNGIFGFAVGGEHGAGNLRRLTLQRKHQGVAIGTGPGPFAGQVQAES